MATLLLRLAGPLQSWGYESKFETRRTLGFPTKSGVIGLLAAALGYSRDEPLDRLNSLLFGIRADYEGKLLRDYHTAKGKKDKDMYITNRYYLSDAIFLVGVESDDEAFIKELEYALCHPAFPLFLGRRSCPPTMPLVLGTREEFLLPALQNEPWLLPLWRQKTLLNKNDNKLRIITDSDVDDPDSSIRDIPVSFSRTYRKFKWRSVCDHGYIEMKAQENLTEHDAFSEVGE